MDNLTDFFATLYVKPDFVWMIPCFSGGGTDVTGGQAVGHETRRFEAYSRQVKPAVENMLKILGEIFAIFRKTSDIRF